MRKEYPLANDPHWQRLSKAYLSRNWQCVRCKLNKRLVGAVEVDHILPVRLYDALKYDESNLQALCHSCHSTKTNHERQGKYFDYRGAQPLCRVAAKPS